MATKNLVSVSINPTDIAAIEAKIQSIASMLPFVISLTAKERQGGIKLGDKSVAFMGKALDYADKNPKFVPNYVDLAETKKDYQLAVDLLRILRVLAPLTQNIEDTAMEAGVEAFSPALSFYNSVKDAAQKDIPGAKAIYQDLSERFPGRSSRKSDPTTVSAN